MPFIFIDRRRAGRRKSQTNRQKLIRRVKGFIKQSLPTNIGQGTVAGRGGAPSSPVMIAGKALEEPSFVYARHSGETTYVLPGNDEYDRGDEIDLSSEESSGRGGGPGDAGEDDFIVHVARDEFLELFFEDCELPDLVNEKWTERTDNTMQPAGFSTTGNPAQLSVIRTYRQALARRRALGAPYAEEIEKLEEQLKALEDGLTGGDLSVEEREVLLAELLARLEELRTRHHVVTKNFDKVDLRYKKREAKPLKTVDAVLFMIMDISGSMDQDRKTIARRWFALLYAFIKRRYANTELVFIAHTDEVFEMSENDFFSTRLNGGTCVSPALAKVNQIIKERYDPNQTNIYISHASDGDNYDDDGEAVIDELLDRGRLLDKVQLFNYVEVGKAHQTWFPSSVATSSSGGREDTNLWEAYQFVQSESSVKKMPMAIIETPDECYPIFKKIFKKRLIK